MVHADTYTMIRRHGKSTEKTTVHVRQIPIRSRDVFEHNFSKKKKLSSSDVKKLLKLIPSPLAVTVK